MGYFYGMFYLFINGVLRLEMIVESIAALKAQDEAVGLGIQHAKDEIETMKKEVQEGMSGNFLPILLINFDRYIIQPSSPFWTIVVDSTPRASRRAQRWMN